MLDDALPLSVIAVVAVVGEGEGGDSALLETRAGKETPSRHAAQGISILWTMIWGQDRRAELVLVVRHA